MRSKEASKKTEKLPRIPRGEEIDLSPEEEAALERAEQKLLAARIAARKPRKRKNGRSEKK